jgi:hypothetical protein
MNAAFGGILHFVGKGVIGGARRIMTSKAQESSIVTALDQLDAGKKVNIGPIVEQGVYEQNKINNASMVNMTDEQIETRNQQLTDESIKSLEEKRQNLNKIDGYEDVKAELDKHIEALKGGGGISKVDVDGLKVPESLKDSDIDRSVILSDGREKINYHLQDAVDSKSIKATHAAAEYGKGIYLATDKETGIGNLKTTEGYISKKTDLLDVNKVVDEKVGNVFRKVMSKIDDAKLSKDIQGKKVKDVYKDIISSIKRQSKSKQSRLYKDLNSRLKKAGYDGLFDNNFFGRKGGSSGNHLIMLFKDADERLPEHTMLKDKSVGEVYNLAKGNKLVAKDAFDTLKNVYAKIALDSYDKQMTSPEEISDIAKEVKSYKNSNTYDAQEDIRYNREASNAKNETQEGDFKDETIKLKHDTDIEDLMKEVEAIKETLPEDAREAFDNIGNIANEHEQVASHLDDFYECMRK